MFARHLARLKGQSHGQCGNDSGPLQCLRRADQCVVTDGKDPATGRFTKGNRFWEARSTFGRKPLFSDPDDLWKACCEYFEWVADNPLMEAKAFAYQGEVTDHDLPKMRAMTMTGMCIFLDMSDDTWRDYRSKPAFSEVCAAAEQVVRTQKFEGAAAGLLNHAIIARDLGMADRSEVTGKDGAPLGMTDMELARWIAFMMTKAVEEHS